MTNDDCTKNTDREIWREREGDYYADSIFVTQEGNIGIDCGGHVIIKSIRDWHRCALMEISVIERQTVAAPSQELIDAISKSSPRVQELFKKAMERRS